MILIIQFIYRPIYVNVDSPNQGFPYSRGVLVKKKHPVFNTTVLFYCKIPFFAHFLRKVNTRSSFSEEKVPLPPYTRTADESVSKEKDSLSFDTDSLIVKEVLFESETFCWRKWCKCLFLDESKFWNWTRIFVIWNNKNSGAMMRLQRKFACLRLWASLFNFEIAMLQVCWGFCRKPGNDRPVQGVTLNVPKLGSYTSFRKTLIVIVQIFIVGQGSKSPHNMTYICTAFNLFNLFLFYFIWTETFYFKDVRCQKQWASLKEEKR